MQLDEDSFRALARSSPWRFRSLHFVASGFHPGEVEAWLSRPGHLRVRHGGEDHEIFDDRRRSTAVLVIAWSAPDETPLPDAGVVASPPALSLPHEVEPVLRPDGLVAERPAGVAYDDPMWQSYRWVAALDPVELAVGTELADLREASRAGRSTWWADVRPREDYEPRCECCALLPNALTDRREGLDPRPAYSSSYTVGLDVATGIVVSLDPQGGDLGYSADVGIEILSAE